MEEPPVKKQKIDSAEEHVLSSTSNNKDSTSNKATESDPRSRGQAPVKAEYLLSNSAPQGSNLEDDAAEASKFNGGERESSSKDQKEKRKKQRGQNRDRNHGSWGDKLSLCGSRTYSDEFSPKECPYGEKCRFEHNLRKYLREGKHDDLDSFDGCPVFQERGFCPAGWKCRFLSSHSKEIEREDGRKELVLVRDNDKMAKLGENAQKEEVGIYNTFPAQFKIDVARRRVPLEKAQAYTKWLTETWTTEAIKNNNRKRDDDAVEDESGGENGEKADQRAAYVDPPYRPSEKRRIYYGADTPVVAPLTTQGNLPFRRLCISLGAQLTFSEMAMGLPLLQGNKSDWALLKAHETEITPPTIDVAKALPDYDHSKDLKFGVQIEANKPWMAISNAELLSTHCPHVRIIDLNCGCPIDLVCKSGGGSGLLDYPSKLEKMLRGMTSVSGTTPISCKIRMGTRDAHPMADSLVRRLIQGSPSSLEAGIGPCGVAAITLHGRTKQQRYTRQANWTYISEIGAIIQRLQKEEAELQDTVREVDPRDKPNGGKTYFLGNGDVYSHIDYFEHLEEHKVDAVMIGRGALIKPWIFEEISAGQYIDKSSTERLEYIKQFVKNGFDTWGSDEKGVGTTRRFLMEWLSFTYRYVPIGILERLPPKLNERPPAYRGRDELETLMASPDVRDWGKIADMFLGKAGEGFKFVPKHKSNSYEIEAEG